MPATQSNCDHQANGFALVNVQHAVFDQEGIDRRVKPGEVNDVVDVAIGIVVQPAGGDGAKYFVAVAMVGLGFGGFGV